jgi:hypothetical protein
MPDIHELHKGLLELPRRAYSELIVKVDAERKRAIETREPEPAPGISRDEFARWVGRLHYEIDKGIIRVLHFPTGAPVDEVRLLEVNGLLPLPENAPVVAFDFMPDIEGVNYRLFVADVTPRQFDEIQAGRIALPTGWSLEGFEDLTPDQQ